MPGPDDVSQDREVLGGVGAPIEERPQRRQSDRDRSEDDCAVLLGAFVYGPDQLGLTNGFVPTDLARMTIANFPLLVFGAFALGAFLVAAAALKIRSEQARVASA